MNNGAKGHTKVVLSVVGSVLGILLLLGVAILFVFSKRMGNKESEPRRGTTENLFVIWSYDGKLVYENIIEATEDFNAKHCIGVGRQGMVYKAEFPSGQVVAVKKLHTLQDGELANLSSFTTEIRALTEIRHRNIIRLYGFCSHPRHSLLVYEFLERGSLLKILSYEEEALGFEWSKRVNVVKGLADALSYMHHDCLPPVIHRDISSKNVLLDSECVAHLSDFGTARLISPQSSNWTSFGGTFGYAAPELAYTMDVNKRLDAYSFGVVTLDVLMGRHPGDLLSSLSLSSGLSSSSDLSPPTANNILLIDILDKRLPIPRNQVAGAVVFAAKLALACLHPIPQCRPTMQRVSLELAKESPPLQYALPMITLVQLYNVNFLTS
ncbi:MDIS1-interacting receptor like kinase 2-like [Rhododendron vialii]|uniref:MDIS1-interacting receptor like kinase 2-like n=1 Tax=Rhododendron vialii TaxID=182163 RepID=UPI00265FD127|nr:MDIS1-interacting receptor like kinase 2-like [Rhododendron vialii]